MADTMRLQILARRIARMQNEAEQAWPEKLELQAKRKSKKRDAALEAWAARKQVRVSVVNEAYNEARAIYKTWAVGCFQAGEIFSLMIERARERMGQPKKFSLISVA